MTEDDYLGRHEILDRAEIIMSLVDDIVEHQCIRDDEKKLAKDAFQALFDLYQLIGKRNNGVMDD